MCGSSLNLAVNTIHPEMQLTEHDIYNIRNVKSWFVEVSGRARSQNRSWRRTVARTLFLYVFVPYTVVVLMLVFLQRRLIYLPTRQPEIRPEHAELEPGRVRHVSVTSRDGLSLNGWHVLPDGQHAVSAADGDDPLKSARWVVLYFHGNAGNRTYRVRDCLDFSRLGAHVLLFDYRGYGDNPGSPSEEHLVNDAHAIWRYVTGKRQVPPERIVIYGESLGGGVGTRLAAQLCQSGSRPGGLILNSTFSSLTDTATRLYPWIPVRWLLVDRYPSVDHAPDVTCPVVQIHGAQDDLVPIDLGRKLFRAFPDRSAAGRVKTFVELADCGHNDIPVGRFRNVLADLLARRVD